jgi:hypothetical protein
VALASLARQSAAPPAAVARAYDWTGIEARLGDEARGRLAAPG